MHWYAVSTKAHQEDLAEFNLNRLGVETFCPLLKQNKIIRRRRQTVISPLFPGYLFARIDLDTRYRAVRYCQGVRTVVSFGDAPVIVEEELIESIKARIEGGYVTIKSSSFKPGQIVRIQEGPLRGLEAVFDQELSDRHRVMLLLKALSYQARVVVDSDYIVSAVG